MTIRDLRTVTGMSRAKFGELYSIPARSIQNWEEGKRNPPEYVLRLLDRVVREDFPGAYSDFAVRDLRAVFKCKKPDESTPDFGRKEKIMKRTHSTP